MLPKYYRFKCKNSSGVTATISLKWMPYQVIAGVTTYGTEVTPISSQSVADAGTYTSSAIDNSSDKNHGGFGTFIVNPGSTPTGAQQYYLYLEKSNDNSSFGSQDEEVIGTLVLTTTGAQQGSFQVRF